MLEYAFNIRLIYYLATVPFCFISNIKNELINSYLLYLYVDF